VLLACRLVFREIIWFWTNLRGQMKILKSKRMANIDGKLVFKLSPVAAGCAVFLSALSANVYAQEATVTTPAADSQQALDSNGKPIASVTVTGIRRGIEAAISIKKNSNSIVEAISAEDIGKLPDATVAESISRLAGVTAQRNKNTGRASDISVRGLSPDFNGALLNGREQASSGDSRGVQFDLYPAEMMGSITIYKSPDATLVGQGIASTIDQRTVMPLDFAKRTMAASYKREKTGMHNGGLESGSGYRTSLTYIDQFADRTIGLAIGGVKFSDSGAEQYQADGWGGWTPSLTDAGAPKYNGLNPAVPGGFKTDVQKIPKKQEGVMGILQFRPNREFMTTVDLFHSKNNDHVKLTGFEGAICGSTGPYDPSGVLSNATIVNNVVVSGTCSNFKADVRNHVDDVKDTLDSWGLNSQYRTNGWTLTADVAGSKVTHDSSRYETTAGQPGNATNIGSISWTGFDGKSNLSPHYTSSLNYSDRNAVVLTDQAGWGGGLTGNPQAGYVAIGVTTDKVNQGRLSAKHALDDMGPISGVEFGFNQTNRDKSRDQNEGNLIIPGGNPYGSAPVPGTGIMITPQSGIPVVNWDPQGSLGSIYALLPKVDQPIQTDKNWAVSEKVTTLYAMGNLEGQLFGLNYRGNFGGQYIHTKQSSQGFVVDTSKCDGAAGKPCPAYTIHGEHKYNDFLPSANVGFELPYDQMLRFGLAKTLSRGQMKDMRPGGGVSLNSSAPGGAILSGGAGNPNLEPFRAKALDVSWEKYFEVNGAKGYVAAAGFYKKLDSYILSVPKVVDFSTLGLLSANTPLPSSGPNKGSTVGILTTPVNGTGGNIHGIELSASLPFAMFSSYLNGFGLAVNHSVTLSSVDLLTTGLTVMDTGGVSTIPLPGLSRQVTNARLFYEANGFQASVAARHRGNFLGKISDFQDNEQLTFIKASTTVDFQAGYEFSSGMLKGLSLVGTVQNWTNAPFVRYAADPKSEVENIKFGRVYGLQAIYKF
jgi:iron complex outermembrane recepter protein